MKNIPGWFMLSVSRHPHTRRFDSMFGQDGDGKCYVFARARENAKEAAFMQANPKPHPCRNEGHGHSLF